MLIVSTNITFTDLSIPTNINTHNTELQMVRIHTNIHKYITFSILYLPPRDASSPHYATLNITSYSISPTHIIPSKTMPMLKILSTEWDKH